jgi:hypothetical protein
VKMKRYIGVIAVVALALGLVVEAASAQLAGNPVYAINPGVGITLAGDFGRGLNDESGKTNFYGGRVVLGVPMLSFWVGGGVWDPRTGGDKQTALGGGAAINLIKAPILPVALTLQVGAATVSCGDDCTDISAVAGPALKVNVPNPAIGIEPWIMPRVQVFRESDGGISDTEAGFGVSGGLNINMPMGLGLHVVADWSSIGDPAVKPLVGGIGLHYKIAVPSLGMPLVPVVN